jgi:uncharacterized membrane protein YphA (DoxX/SURF4 family)
VNVVIWVVQGLLGLAFLASGSVKLSQPKEKLATTMGWVEDFTPPTIKLIAGLELLAALGLILPAVTGIAVILTPLAALGLILIMLGAIATHARRKELPYAAINLVLLALAAVVVWGRFGPYSL